MKTFYSVLAAIMVIGGIIISIVFFRNLSDGYTISSDIPVFLSESGLTGDFVGGVVGTIFSLAGFFILIVTLSSQNKANYIDRFETNFFELLKIHRENIIDLKKQIHNKAEPANPITHNGRKVIQLIVSDVLKCREEVKIFFRKRGLHEIYEPEYAKRLNSTFKYSNPKVDLLKLAKLNIPYCIVFFGVDAEGRRIIERMFEGKYKQSFYKPVLDFISLKPVEGEEYFPKWEEIRNISDYRRRIKIGLGVLKRRGSTYKRNEFLLSEQCEIERLWYKNDYIKYYGGNQFRLGHYFRHLYQTVTFVDNENKLNGDRKYFYIKTLRAQLSTHEQTLLFINSLSFLGMVWELTPKYVKSKFERKNQKRAKDKMLITKYQLIKNIPNQDIFGFKIKEFYPSLKLETDESYLNDFLSTN